MSEIIIKCSSCKKTFDYEAEKSKQKIVWCDDGMVLLNCPHCSADVGVSL